MNYGQGPGMFSVNLRLSRTWGWGERAAGTQTQNPNRGGGFGGPGGRGRGGFGALGGGGTGKRYNLTATVSARNALNHTNLGTPNGTLVSPFFGIDDTGGPGRRTLRRRQRRGGKSKDRAAAAFPVLTTARQMLPNRDCEGAALALR